MILTALLSALAACLGCLGALELRDWWTKWRAPKPAPPAAQPDTSAIFAVVRHTSIDEGLAADAIVPSFDLAATGKLYAVLHHSAAQLGKDHELRTVQDVVDWIAAAPTR